MRENKNDIEKNSKKMPLIFWICCIVAVIELAFLVSDYNEGRSIWNELFNLILCAGGIYYSLTKKTE